LQQQLIGITKEFRQQVLSSFTAVRLQRHRDCQWIQDRCAIKVVAANRAAFIVAGLAAQHSPAVDFDGPLRRRLVDVEG